MSVAMPTKLVWQNLGGNDPTTGRPLQIQPVVAKVGQGWEYGEKPPHNEFNWIQNNTNDWQDWNQRYTIRTAARMVTAQPGVEADPDPTEFITTGAADDVEINAAIQAAAAGKGGIIALSEGLFDIDAALVLESNITIQGQGPGKTIIRIVNTPANFAAFDGTAGGLSNVTIRDLQIDGNKGAPLVGNYVGISIDASDDILIENVYVHDIGDNGATNAHGIDITGASERVVIRGCRVEDVDTSGIITAATSQDVRVFECFVARSGDWNGRFASTGCVVHGCFFEEAVASGEVLLAAPASMSGCRVTAVAGAAGVGIRVSVNGIGSRIDGCRVAAPDSYGIEIQAGADRCAIVGNYVTDTDDSAIYCAGDDCVIADNVIFTTNKVAHDAAGIEVIGTTNALTGNIIRSIDGDGINVAATGLGTCITGGTIAAPRGHGISVLGAASLDVTITGVHIDMEGTVTGNGVNVTGDDCTVVGCHIFDNAGAPTLTDGVFTSGLRTTIQDCRITSATGIGIDISADDCIASGCFVFITAADGIRTTADRTQIVGCRVRTAGTNGIHIGGATDALVSGCWVYISGTNGILVDGVSDDFVITGCILKNNNTTAAGANTSDIYITQPSDGGIITGCRCTNPAGAPQVVNGIFLDNGAPGVTNIYVHGNMVQIGSGATIADAGGLGIGQSGGAVIPGAVGVEANEAH